MDKFLFLKVCLYSSCIFSAAKHAASLHRQVVQSLRHVVSCWEDTEGPGDSENRDCVVLSCVELGVFFADSSAQAVLTSNYPQWYHLTFAVSLENSEVLSVESIGRGGGVEKPSSVRSPGPVWHSALKVCTYCGLTASFSPSRAGLMVLKALQKWKKKKKKFKSRYPGNASHI